MKKISCVFTGGGSGGHIFPALSVARELVSQDPKFEPVFFGAKRGMEASLFPKQEFTFKLLNVGPLNSVGASTKLLSLIKLPFAVLYCVFYLLLKNTRFVIGFGGYASAPMTIAAKILGRNFFLWEGNATPGMLTRKVMNSASYIFLAVEDKKSVYKNLPTEVVGVPTRIKAVEFPKTYQDLDKRKTRVLIFGGSQGARSINLSVKNLIETQADLFDKFEICHQVGKSKKFPVNLAAEHQSSYEQLEFIHNMMERYEWADFAICRSGASTIAELGQSAMPSIFVPLATAADNHQYINAQQAENSGAAILIEDKLLDAEVLLKAMNAIDSSAKLATMSKAALKSSPSDCQQKIVNRIISSI